jgi:voltage-gated potassium channel
MMPREAGSSEDTAATGGRAAGSELANTGYEIFIGALSVLSLVNIVLFAFMQDQATQTAVELIDLLLSGIFLIDFLFRLHRAPSRSGYFFRGYGWADLLASLPFPQAKILRIFRLISIAMLIAERSDPDANIKTASDAMWYIIVTMSTVGYGDRYPVTNHGRELGTLVIVVGVGIFGTLTGYLANLFLSPQPAPAGTSSADPARQLVELQELMVKQQEVVARLEESLARAGEPAAG